ncbi:hypothetical protein GCM10007870_16460 [Gluconobacter kondonii]|uniref:Uncharacterized protein n=1 Tax=Gluconobacter kondonii TaxID=941463 RepID=A0ABQ5WSP2_9PROT|nr:hypothetical protein GCM10007870_16460 [Gluconobacter kondonii]
MDILLLPLGWCEALNNTWGCRNVAALKHTALDYPVHLTAMPNIVAAPQNEIGLLSTGTRGQAFFIFKAEIRCLILPD